MASSAPKSKRTGYKQRRMGPAPFASFEDLSDDLDSPEEKQSLARPLPGIREDVTLMSPGSAGGGLQTPSTPRIDISRASSSSHHDSNNSRDSSPERELFAGAGDGSGAKLGLGFKEEGAADLRSSTEELDFHEEPATVTEREARQRRERRLIRQQQQQQQQQVSIFKYELEAQSEKERKDSACSDVALLSISGRTSRLSSIGSGGSGASHISGMSHLSVMSGHSVASSGRSPSPHKMLLETSFCGSKPIPTQSMDIDSPPNKHETESLEKTLLSRQVDPTIAIVGDMTVEESVQKKTGTEVKEKLRVQCVLNKSEPEERLVRDKERPQVDNTQKKTATQDRTRREKEPPRTAFRNERQLRDRDEWGPHTKQKPVTLNLSEQGKKPITFSQLVQQQHQPAEVTPSASPKLSRHVALKKTENSGSRTPSPPSTSRKSSFTNLFKRNEAGVLSPESPTTMQSKRKASGLSTILKEASEGLRERSRSRSKSRERVTPSMTGVPPDTKGKKDNKNKSVFSSIFKKRDRKKWTKTSEGDTVSPVDITSPDQKLSVIEPIGNVEFTFNSDANYELSDYGMIRAGERQQPNVSQEYFVRVTTDDHGVWDDSSTQEDRVVYDDHAAKSVHVAPKDLSNQEYPVARVDLVSKDSRVSEGVISHDDCKAKGDGASQEDRVGEIDHVDRLDHVSKGLTKEDYPSHNKSLLPSESVMLPMLGNDGTSTPTVGNSQNQSMPSEDDSKVAEVPESSSIIDHHSSESEKDSEMEYLRTKKKKKQLQPEIEPEVEDHERKGLVVQQDSFEDELPYVPTTLPQERSVAVPMVPIKQRISEVKTCPIERPRSTTPINPSLLEDYMQTEDAREQAVEKMRICLPREDSISGRAKSPRRITKTWFEFAEQGLQSPREYRKPSLSQSSERSMTSPSPPPPPLPPRAQPTPPPPHTPPPKPTAWINFEEIPEKRKPPKRIQTIPSRGTLDLPSDSSKPVATEKTVYSYVNPEECKCECHELAGQGARQQLAASSTLAAPSAQQCSHISTVTTNGQSDISHLDVDSTGDRHSYMSDSSFEYPSPYSLGDNVDYSNGLKPMKPFGMDLDVSSNRSSTISQDEPQSPDLGSPNGTES